MCKDIYIYIIRVYIDISVCIYIYVYAHMYIYIYIHVCVYLYIYIDMYVYVCIDIYVYIDRCVCVLINWQVCVCVYIYIHTYIPLHMHIHTILYVQHLCRFTHVWHSSSPYHPSLSFVHLLRGSSTAVEEEAAKSKTCSSPQNSWLVGGWATPLKNMKVDWDDQNPNIWEIEIFQTTKIHEVDRSAPIATRVTNKNGCTTTRNEDETYPWRSCWCPCTRTKSEPQHSEGPLKMQIKSRYVRSERIWQM